MEKEIEDKIRAAQFGLIAELVREKLPPLKSGESRYDKIQEFALDILEFIAAEIRNDNAMDIAEEVAEYFET